MACGPHGSLESTVEVQQDGLADIVEGLQGLRKVAEGLAALAGDTGYAEGIHMNADYAVAYTEDYAARVGVKVVTVD
jgi:hypothetical protein